MESTKPLPIKTSDTAAFWDACRRHELRFQKCRECGFVRWPPAFLCPHCYNQGADWILSSGRGTVYSFVIYRETYHPSFYGDIPYIVALVELEEGPRFLSNIVDCSLEEVRCDMPVAIKWEDVTEEVSLPKFRPAG